MSNSFVADTSDGNGMIPQNKTQAVLLLESMEECLVVLMLRRQLQDDRLTAPDIDLLLDNDDYFDVLEHNKLVRLWGYLNQLK